MKTHFTHEQIEEALKATVDDLTREDEEEAIEIANGEAFDLTSIQEEDTIVSAAVNLSNIPIAEWDSISVSPRSRFGDTSWDFSDYPNSDPVGGVVVRLRSEKMDIDSTDTSNTFNRIWHDIRRLVVLYTIPHVSTICRINSYSSIKSIWTRTRALILFFKDQSLYIGQPRSKGFRTINDVSEETLTAYIDDSDSPHMRWQLAWSISTWRRLSSAGLVPNDYCLHSTLVTKSYLSALRMAYDTSANPYAPIPLDDYAKILAYASTWLKNFSADALWLQRTYLRSIVSKSVVPVQKYLLEGTFEINSPEGIALFENYQPFAVNGVPWWDFDPKGTNHIGFIIKANSALTYACYTIILATTGMRTSEIHNLKIGCITKTDDGFNLTFEVFKTSAASQGDTKTIPVPELTANAIYALEELGRVARIHGKHQYLCVVTKGPTFGEIVHKKTFAYVVGDVADRAGVEGGIHPHRFRKSLAMYIIYSDPTALEVIKWLFSHKSLKMTLRYILELPGVAKEIKRLLVEQNTTLLAEVVDAALSDRIGGVGGKRIQSTLKQSPIFLAKLQDNGKETLKQYVDSVLDQGIQLLHRTNMAICLKSPALNSESPCVGKNESGVSKLHPNIYACDPLECQHAAFTEANVSALQSEIQFHNRLAKHPYGTPEQQRFSEKRIQLAFRRLKEVIGSDAETFMFKVANG